LLEVFVVSDPVVDRDHNRPHLQSRRRSECSAMTDRSRPVRANGPSRHIPEQTVHHPGSPGKCDQKGAHMVSGDVRQATCFRCKQFPENVPLPVHSYCFGPEESDIGIHK
jgi:hypothetical protein